MYDDVNEAVAVETWTDELKRTTISECRDCANNCLQAVKVAAGEIAKNTIIQLFDHLIDAMRIRWSN